MKEFKFPEGFLWGSGTAAEQIEPNGSDDLTGGRKPTVWNEWFSKEPNRFYEYNFSQNNFHEKYKEDIEIAKNLGFNSLRISISWSRFMNEDGTKNEEGAKFYKDVFTEMRRQGIKPFVCLFHFDTPKFIFDKGGWQSKETIEAFEHYAKTAFAEYDELVEYWFTYNEPNVVIGGSYLGGAMYPCEMNFNKYMVAQWNMLVAHKKAVRALREGGYETKIGMVHSMTPAIPRSDSEADLKAARFSDMFETHSWFGPAIKGEFPKELKDDLIEKGLWPSDIILPEEEELMKQYNIDLIGLNYYTPKRVKALSYVPDWNGPIDPHTHWFNIHTIQNTRMNKSRGWEIFPKSIYTIFKMVRDEYGNLPCFIGENGMGIEEQDVERENGSIIDDYRIDFHKEHIYWVHRALEDGVNVIGYHMWTYIDNWSWANAYKNRYGFIELDLKTGNRIPKKSSGFMSDLAKTNILKTDPTNY